MAKIAIDEIGKPFLHVKAYRGGNVQVELICKGSVKIRCRNCSRWHNIRLTTREVEPIPPPTEI